MQPEGLPADQITGGFVARRRPDVAWVEIDGEVVVYDPADQSSYLLNTTAGLIWRFLDGEDTLDGLADDLADAFDADAGLVRVDVAAAVVDLGRQGLLDGVTPGDDPPGAEGENQPPGEARRGV